MKVFAIFCAAVLAVVLVVFAENASKPDQETLDFYRKLEQMQGIDTNCTGNHTFYEYGDCDDRCDYRTTPDCYGARFISCLACKEGYLPVNRTRNQCVKPEDCP